MTNQTVVRRQQDDAGRACCFSMPAMTPLPSARARMPASRGVCAPRPMDKVNRNATSVSLRFMSVSAIKKGRGAFRLAPFQESIVTGTQPWPNLRCSRPRPKTAEPSSAIVGPPSGTGVKGFTVTKAPVDPTTPDVPVTPLNMSTAKYAEGSPPTA